MNKALSVLAEQELNRLRAENQRLREALQEIADLEESTLITVKYGAYDSPESAAYSKGANAAFGSVASTARAALEAK